MKRIKITRQYVIFAAAFALVLSTVVQSVVSAAQVTERSVRLSSASASAEDVTYAVTFTPENNAGAFVIEFCGNSPVIGESCTAPTGLDATNAESTTTGFTDVTGSTNKVVVAGTITAPTPVTVAIDGIDNPTSAGTIYARIVTYDSDTHADAYASDNLGTGNQDQGGVAIAITPTVGVSGSVLETLTFCVSGSTIDANCTNTTAPVLTLGETVGDAVALTPGVLSHGDIYTQITTNAESGAIVRLKSSATDCGGLLRASDPSACDIKPALDDGLDAGANNARFGVKTSTATDTPAVNAAGTLQPVSGSNYNNSTYALNYVDGNATGVTSAYGDPFLDTADAPVNNKNMALTFGATVSNNTPAGTYATDLSLIATGKF